jgi:hypothetical protein
VTGHTPDETGGRGGEQQTAATTVSIVVQIYPFLMRTGVNFRGNVQALAEQMTRYVGERMSERFTTDHGGAGLFVATVVSRADERGSWQYREGHYADTKESPKEQR